MLHCLLEVHICPYSITETETSRTIFTYMNVVIYSPNQLFTVSWYLVQLH